MNSLASDIQDYQCFINGQWAGAENGETIDVENPATSEVFATVPACSTAQAIEALHRAEQAQAAWQALPPVERAAYLWTRNHSRIMHAIQNLQTGTIFIHKGICG
jgi:lactaldehyde dehydrogenase/glycolaldehyde dehydrogenase